MDIKESIDMKHRLNLNWLVFDLDDTLFPQIEFDFGCLKEAAGYISTMCGKDSREIFSILSDIVIEKGIEYRKIFDDMFKKISFDGMRYIKEILNHYWSAKPIISVFPNTNKVLESFKNKYLLAIITDGYVNIQNYKINALGLNNYFDKIYITDSYGIENRKPSKYVFDVFLRENQLSPEQCVYIGNDPRKDFIPARDVGMHTIRIRQGSFAKMISSKECEADYIVDSISQLTELI